MRQASESIEQLGRAAFDVLENDVRVPLGHLEQAKRGTVRDTLFLFPGAGLTRTADAMSAT
jgi:hypothetical protein